MTLAFRCGTGCFGDGMTSSTGERRRDIKIMGLVGLAHSTSHFFMLVLPPLLPLLKAEFGVGYAELGLIMTVFFTCSGLAQTPAGFLVDRLGAPRVLFAGIALLSGAVMLYALMPSYGSLLPLAALAGLGNSVYHPADYAILNATIHHQRIGRAYSLHTLGSNVGWAVAPITVLTLATLFGWRAAVLAAGGIGLLILLILVSARALFDDAGASRSRRASPTHADVRRSPKKPAAGVLLSGPVALCFGYFLFLAVATIGIQTFLPSVLKTLHDTPLTVGAAALTGYLVGGAGGILLGGVVADRSRRHGRIVTVGLIGCAVGLLVVNAVALSTSALIAIVAVSGFLLGTTMPSRDMLVRGATPRGASGRVFGFVYSGLDAGSALVPLAAGMLLDHARPTLVLWLLATALLLAVGMARALPRRPAAALRADS